MDVTNINLSGSSTLNSDGNGTLNTASTPALNNLNAKIKIGITATPKRKDGKHVYLSDYFSPFLIPARDPRKLNDPSVRVVQTDVRFPVIDPKRDWSRQLNKLCSNDQYLNLIAKEAISAIANQRCPLILGERVQMLKDL